MKSQELSPRSADAGQAPQRRPPASVPDDIGKIRRSAPALALFFLSPAVGELLSGSAPPAEFFQPLSFLLLSALYGSGAVLAREVAHRWKKGWPSILILGAAYGVLEEGLMVKSFFDPGWVDLGPLGTYGRWGGVNWIWAAGLTLYHAVFSISIPILLVTFAFQETASSAWISDGARHRLLWLLAAVVALGHLFLTSYRPPLSLTVMCFLSVVALIRLARTLPWTGAETTGNSNLKPSRSRWLFFAGLASTMVFFIILWGLPQTGLPPGVTLGLVVAWPGFVLQGLLLVNGGVGWSSNRCLAVASGALAFFILLAPLQELDRTRVDDTRGMTVVALLAAAILAGLAFGRREGSISRTSPSSIQPASNSRRGLP